MIDQIHALAGLQNLTPAGDLESVFARLSEPLYRYTELEFRSDHKRIDLITLHHEPSFVRDFLDVLKERGQVDVSVAEALTRFGTGKVIGMKLPVTEPPAGGELYVRGALPLDESERFIRQYGTEIHEPLRHLAECFHKSYLHMLAVDAGTPRFTVFFTQQLSDNDSGEAALCRALQITGTEAALDQVMEFHAVFSLKRPKTLFFSWGIPFPRVKIDYADVRVKQAAEALNRLGGDETLLTRWSEILSLSKAGYAGIIVTPEGVRDLRVYFTVQTSVYES